MFTGAQDGGMRGYGQYCPVALGAEIFAQRWTPIIVRNLMVGCHRFGEILEGAPGLPRSVLSQRLRRLESDGVVLREYTPTGPTYHLTAAGRELGEVCLSLGVWAARWRDARPVDLDPYLALWMLARLIDPPSLPRSRIVIRFELTDASRPPRYWLVAARSGAEVCVEFPGFDEDGVVTTDACWLVRWHTGRVAFPDALRAGGMTLTGCRWLAGVLNDWGRLSPFADIDPARSVPGPAPAPSAAAP